MYADEAKNNQPETEPNANIPGVIRVRDNNRGKSAIATRYTR